LKIGLPFYFCQVKHDTKPAVPLINTIKNLTKATLKKLTKKLKTRWGIQSTWQFLVILFVFAITGPTTLIVERFVFDLFAIPSGSHWAMRVVFFILITMPMYKALLLLYGFIFGQFAFFWNFVKTFFLRLVGFGRFKKANRSS